MISRSVGPAKAPALVKRAPGREQTLEAANQINDLARRIADGLGATAVITTATDAMGLPGLDEWHIQQTDAETVRAAKDAVMR